MNFVRSVVLVVLACIGAAAIGCGGQCPPGHVFNCQSGPKYGTQCQCVPEK